MKVEEVSSYAFEFDEEEIEVMCAAVNLLNKIQDTLIRHNCENIECIDYEVTETVKLSDIIDAWHMFYSLQSADNIH